MEDDEELKGGGESPPEDKPIPLRDVKQQISEFEEMIMENQRRLSSLRVMPLFLSLLPENVFLMFFPTKSLLTQKQK